MIKDAPLRTLLFRLLKVQLNLLQGALPGIDARGHHQRVGLQELIRQGFNTGINKLLQLNGQL